MKDEMALLSDLSVRIGRNTLLTQANTGNVSLKDGQNLIVKASGTWLADAANQNIFARMDLNWAREQVRSGLDPAKQHEAVGQSLPSVETALHAVLPHRVVIHVHSVNVIAWAVRCDGPACLESRLDGLRWAWIPYVPSGLPLAHAVEHALSAAHETNVFVLANHGLVVAGSTCARAEALLWEVERRVALTARKAPKPDVAALRQVASDSEWRPASNVTVHALGTDPESDRILSGGLMYPCQAIFSPSDPASLYRAVAGPRLLGPAGSLYRSRPFLIVQDWGVVTNSGLSPAGAAILTGLAQVVRRIPEYAAVRYLTEQEIADLDMQTYVAAGGPPDAGVARHAPGN